MKLGIVNYGLGNILSIVNAIELTSKDCKIKLLNTADELQDQDKLILPGVGAFGDAADKYNLTISQVIPFRIFVPLPS